jgi:hypothetical protein
MEELVAEYKETTVVSSGASPSKSSASPWLAFIVGGLLIAVVALLVMNVHGTVQGPGGRVDINVKPPVTTPVAPAPATR